MKYFLDLGNRYMQESDWKDLSLLKFCLFAMGLLIGTQVTEKYKKPVISISLGVFIATYIPLMSKLFKIMGKKESDTSA